MWAVPNDYRLDARDAMDAFYGAGGWTYRTAPHLGSDLGAALNVAMAAARLTYPRLEVVIPPTGLWMMKTPIQPAALAGNHVHGAGGPWGTSIVFDSDETCLYLPFTDAPHEGGMFTDLMFSLEQDHPNGGSFLVPWSDPTGSSSGYVFERLRVSAFPGSFWQYSVAANGVARVGPPFGIRGLTIRDSDFFCARDGGLWAQGIVEGLFDNCGFFVPKVGTPGADITIGGGSVEIYTRGLITAGQTHLSQTTTVVGDMMSAGGLIVDSTVTSAGVVHSGPVYGAVGSGFVTQI